MKRAVQFAVRLALASSLTWSTAALCYSVPTNRSIASMILVLEVLAVAALGDWLLALLTSTAAALGFSWYFVDNTGSFRITTWEGALTLGTMAFTALTGSFLSLRADRRAQEAIRRREEMERLQQLGTALLSANSVQEAADSIVARIVELFGVSGAVLGIEGTDRRFRAGATASQPAAIISFQPGSDRNYLELYGAQPSAEVRSALANLINLGIDRARAAEERARTEAAQRGEELRNNVLNALAHNFKTPLTSIKAAASVLRRSPDVNTEQSRELTIVIDEEADRLDQLIRESLDVARIQAHKDNPSIEECSMASIAARVRSRVSSYLGTRELTISMPDDLPPVRGEKFLLEQMLMQVVDNAWKYSRPGSKIRVSGIQAEDNLILTVQNDGSRIPDEERERIFSRFYRGAATRAIEGTGLGLTIARAIAEAHGGSVWLDPEPDGPTFRFSLPVQTTGKTIDREPHYITH